MPQAEPGSLMQLVEECDTLADQLDFLGVVELETEGAGGDRGGQGCKCRAFFQDDSLEAGALREEGGGAPDDPAPDDDEVGRLGR